MPAIVYFHKSFHEGSVRTKYFSDYLSLKDDEKFLLFHFITHVKLGNLLPGKNKTSWTNTKGEEILSSSVIGYKSCKLWHYHVGPHSNNNTLHKKGIRDINLEGETSGAVVHYKWYDPSSKEKLIIIAFSPLHDPFPKPRDRNNIIPNRSGAVKLEDLILG
ncbi:TPA: hypothetical protein ACKP7K_004689 [Serratia marcescens]